MSEKVETLVFGDAELDWFAEASRDTNPLHRDEDYARGTQFGRRVVFGMLGSLAALGRVPVPPDHRFRQLSIDFSGPLFVGEPYALSVRQLGPERWSAILSEGSRVLMKVVVRLEEGVDDRRMPVGSEFGLRRVPASRDSADIGNLETLEGRYRVDAAAFARLCERLGVDPRVISPTVGTVLLWSSWLVGMEIPGRQALFNGATFDFDGGGAAVDGFDFAATVKSVDPRFGLIRTGAVLKMPEGALARCEVRSFVRREADPATDPDLPAQLGTGEPLAGKVALVIGASRGLGAYIARALALRGAVVYGNYLRGADRFARLRAHAGEASERLVDAPGDGADAAWCAETVGRIVREHGRLDLLVCNACPTILPMAYEASSAPAVHAYIGSAVALASHPLAAALDVLAQSGGTAVVVSSVYAEKSPPNFPHYVAAKCAVEGLVRSAAKHHTKVGFLLVRPPRLEGEINIPYGGETALPVSRAAVAIVDAVGDAVERGTAHVLTIAPGEGAA